MGLRLLIFVPWCCACTLPSTHIPRFDSVRDVGLTGSLHLRPGTNLAEARRRLSRLGATNITSSGGFAPKADTRIDVLTADHLQHVLLFRDRSFHGALSIGSDAGTSSRLYLHVASAEGSTAVIVVGPTLRHQGVPSVFVLLDQSPTRRYIIAYDHFPEWYKGIVDPKIIGSELEQGVTFVARDERGFPWDSALLLACDGKRVAVTRFSMQEALGCSCLFEWFNRGR